MFRKNKITFFGNKSVGSKLLRVYKPILFILLACGFNYDFYKCTKSCSLIVKLYCVTLTIITGIAAVTCCPSSLGSNILSLIEYVMSIYVLLYMNDNTSLFFKKMHLIDSTLRIPNKYYDKTKFYTFFMIILIWVIRITFTTCYCFYNVCFKYFILYLIECFILLSLDVNRTWRFLMFNIIRCRLNFLRVRLEETWTENIYLFITNKKMVRENKLRICLRMYKDIADAVDLVNPFQHTSVNVMQ